MYSVYILYSTSADCYYIGHTADLARRLISHNTSDKKRTYTCSRRPWVLVFKEDSYSTRSDAMKREREIKGWKSKVMIEKLIKESVGKDSTSREKPLDRSR